MTGKVREKGEKGSRPGEVITPLRTDLYERRSRRKGGLQLRGEAQASRETPERGKEFKLEGSLTNIIYRGEKCRGKEKEPHLAGKGSFSLAAGPGKRKENPGGEIDGRRTKSKGPYLPNG